MPGAGTVGENGAVGKNHSNFVKNAIFLTNRFITDSTVVPGAPPPEGGGGFPRPGGGGGLIPLEGGGLVFPGLSNDGCDCPCSGNDDCDCACGHGASSISNGISLLYPIMILAFW